MSLAENLAKVERLINQACMKSNRDPQDIKIIAVTKYVDIEKTKQVLDLGLENIGENVVQNAIPKLEELAPSGKWHFIGRLQTNKVKYIIGKFDFIHSLDRLSLAEEINKRALQQNLKVKCFIQVNIAREKTKTGIDPEDLLEFAQKLIKFEGIEVIGLMTMAPHEEDKENTRGVFKQLRELRDLLNGKKIFLQPITELSMGMSNDFEIAIEEGATFVRLGSILVGKD